MKVTRRNAFLATLAAPFAALGSVPHQPRREFFANWKENEFNREAAIHLCGGGSKAYVDGKEIKSVWYINTLTGRVRSYDIYQNGGEPMATEPGWEGAFSISPERRPIIHGVLVEDACGVLSITLRGRIELFSKSGQRLY
jgi:hypothetical protein